MAVTISEAGRAKVLEVAASIAADPQHAEDVVANAVPLLAWLEAAPGSEDLALRWRAMSLCRWDITRRKHDGDPGGFLREAGILHAFLARGSAA